MGRRAVVLAALLLAANSGSAAIIPQLVAADAGVVRVDVRVSGGEADGSSWADAFDALQEAIDHATPGDEVWVARGIYTPSASSNGGLPTDRAQHFSLRRGVEVYGGFDGTETERGQRDWRVNTTILSGDIGREGDHTDNCYHVFYHPDGADLDSSALLDGFTITLGNADGNGPEGKGGGMYNFQSSPTLRHCSFVANSADEGGGMYNDSSEPTLIGCVFGDNVADDGGAMYNDYFSAPQLTDCDLSANRANWNGGGVLNDYFSSPILSNCRLSGNAANWNGGGMFNYNASLATLIDCSLVGNSAWQGGGMYNYFSSPTVTGCVIRGNNARIAGNGVYNLYAFPAFFGGAPEDSVSWGA